MVVDDTGHDKGSIPLLISAWIFHWIQSLDLGMIYDYTFKILSLISVALVVGINISKIIHYYKKKKNDASNKGSSN